MPFTAFLYVRAWSFTYGGYLYFVLDSFLDAMLPAQPLLDLSRFVDSNWCANCSVVLTVSWTERVTNSFKIEFF